MSIINVKHAGIIYVINAIQKLSGVKFTIITVIRWLDIQLVRPLDIVLIVVILK